MKRPLFALLLPLLLALAGCVSNPPLNFSVQNIGVSSAKLDAEMRSLSVTLANPGEKKGDLPAWAQFEVPMMWESALSDAVNRTVIFTDDADLKVNLLVKILAIEVPSMGASFTTRSVARYEVINRANGDTLYSHDVDTSATVPLNYAFMGAVRMRESLNRSVQSNITMFLEHLQSVGASAMPSGQTSAVMK